MTKCSAHIDTSEALNRMRSAGLLVDEIIMDGQRHRVPTEGKPRGKDGAYRTFLDHPISIWWQNWRTGEEGTWSVGIGKMAPAEKEALRKRAEAARQERNEKDALRHDQAAARAAVLYQEAVDCTGHPYLSAKGVKPVPGLKVKDDRTLLVPMYNKENKLRSLQQIWQEKDKNGNDKFVKTNFKDGDPKGHFFPIGGGKDPESPLLIGEGLSTCLSLYESTGLPVLTAFSKDNLLRVAQTSRELYPARKIILCADNDIKEGDINGGMEKATAAARAVGGLLAIPELPTGAKVDFNDLHQIQGPVAVKQAVEAAREVEPKEDDQDTLEEEQAAILPPPPAVPLDAFPAPVVTLLEEAAEAFTVPLQVPAACLLALLSSLVGRSRCIMLKESWQEPGNLWIAVVAPSGLGKTPCMSAFFKPIRDLEYAAKKEYDEQYEAFENDLSIYNGKRLRAVKETVNGESTTDLSFLLPPEKPTRKRATVDDATAEALSDVLNDNPKGVLWRKDELAGLMADLDKYSAGKGGTKSRLLSSYNCEPWDVIRSSNPKRNLYIPHACVGIFGGIQPGMLGKVFDAGASGTDEASGFLQRFTFIRAEAEGPSYWNEQSFSQASQSLLECIAGQLWHWDTDRNELGEETSPAVLASPEARVAYIEWYNTIAREEFLAQNSALLAKLKGQAQRICLLLHALEAALDGSDGFESVQEATMRNALLLADWIKAHQEQCWRFFQPKNRPEQIDPIQRAIMEVIVDQAALIEKDGWKISNANLCQLVEENLAMPGIAREKIGRAASALKLPLCLVGQRRLKGRTVTPERINTFRATISTVSTVSNHGISCGTGRDGTVSLPSQPSRVESGAQGMRRYVRRL